MPDLAALRVLALLGGFGRARPSRRRTVPFTAP